MRRERLGLLVLCGLAACAHPGPTATLPDGSIYEGEYRNGRFHGRGKLTYPSGTTYEGEFRGGLVHGEGTLIHASGTRYVGSFQRGQRDGKGRIEYADGDVYEGGFRDDGLTGPGVYTLANGNVYRGTFRNGDLYGPGAYTQHDGDEYVGEFEAGKFHGRGTLRFTEGVVYEGEFARSRFEGTGTLTKPDGTTYVGQFADGRYNGVGTLTKPDGTTYVGQFADRRYHGFGTLTKANGASYTGSFEKGKYHGEGKYVTKRGYEFTGQFTEGTFTGRGTYRVGDYVYTGDFVKWDFNGQGTLVRPDGTTYTGEFADDRVHGHGRLEKSNGEVYVGEFVEGEEHGSGILTWTDDAGETRVAHGEWEAGQYVSGDTPELLAPPPIVAERLLYDQPDRVAAAVADVRASRPGVPDLYFVGFAPWAAQDVFMKEVRFTERVLSEELGAEGRAVALLNHRVAHQDAPLATVTNLERVLHGVAERMHPEEDVLFLLLTSHGSEDHEVAVELEEVPLEQLDPERLTAMLDSAGIRWKVVVVSGCYSGGFVDALRGDDTLVITAAAADRKSFGCSDEAEFTTFGGAFLRDELATAPNFVAAFERARTQVRQLEEEQELEPSDPQLATAPPIERKLAEWRSSLLAAPGLEVLPGALAPE